MSMWPIARPLPRWISKGLDGALPAANDQNSSSSAMAVSAEQAAGAALGALDGVVRADPPWMGCLRMRLALKAASRLATRCGLDGEETALRDAVHFTRPGDDPGPAGRLHILLRTFCRLSPTQAAEPIALLADEIDRRPAAAAIVAALEEDRSLGSVLGWPAPLPLHLLGAAGPAARAFGATDDRHARAVALGRGVMAAHALALGLDRRANDLFVASSKIRTKGAKVGLAQILSDDAITPARMAGRSAAGLGSDRAARRFCERLVGQGGLAALTDRPTHRLYGL